MTCLLNALLALCFAIICYTDIRWMIIPNTVNAVVLAGGLTAAWWQAGIADALISCCMIYTLLWTIRHVHFKATGRIGLGLGDVKLGGASATWFSLSLFPFFLLFASALALIFYGITMLRFPRRDRRLPFGPFLAASLIVTWNIEQTLGSIGFGI